MAKRLDIRARSRAIARLTAYVAVVGLGLGAFGLHAARAEAGKAGLSLGRQLLPLTELESERTTIAINGQSLFVASAIVEGDVASILDRFDHECTSSPSANAAAGKEWPAVARRRGPAPSHDYAPRLEVFRRQGPGDHDGVVFCFAHGERPFAEAALRYRETHELGAFGALRYAYVTRTEDQRVRVIATWTEGSFRLDARTPSGDAAGSDPEATPRPPGSKRLLSARLGESPYGMYAFASSDSPEAVMRFYDDALAREHWVAISPAALTRAHVHAEESAGLENARSYVKDGVQVLVSATPDPRQHTLVSIGELGAQSAQR